MTTEVATTGGAAGPPPLRTPSLRRRLFVTVLVLLTALLAVLAVTVDQVLHARLEGQLEQRLLDRARVAQLLAGSMQPADLVRQLSGEGVSVRYEAADGSVTTAGPPVPSSALSAAAAPAAKGPARPGPAAGTGQPGSDPVARSGTVLSVSRPLAGSARIVLASDAGDLRRTLAQVRIVIASSCLVALLVAALALLFVVRRVLAPLDRMTDTARSITAGDRGRRLRPDRSGTELGRTAAAFDEALDAVEASELRAREAEHRVRAFLSDAAHELRTPLAGVQASAEQLLRGGPARDGERLALGVVREARRAARLVDDMTTMARIDRGLDLHLQRLPLTAVAELVAGVLERRAQRAVAPSLQLRTGEVAGAVLADRDRLTQVVANLVENAARAAGPHGRLTVLLAGAAGRATITVQDDGPGVPPHERDRVFDRLVRLDEARSRDAGGCGLGLPIARGIARAHGGDVVCQEPDDGVGASFAVTLPLAAAVAAPTPPARVAPAALPAAAPAR